MLNFEQMKASLQSEKKRLETIIEKQEMLISYMEKFDKKMFNKKIVDYINEADGIRAYINICFDRKELVIYHKDLPYNYNNIFWRSQESISNEKRFSYEKFKAELLKIKNDNLADLAAVEADLADGEKRAQEIAYVKDYYKKLVKGFSHHVRNKFEDEFKIGYIY